MARLGWRKLPSQTPLDFVAAIQEAALQKKVARFTRAYESARFRQVGGRRPKPAGLFKEITAAETARTKGARVEKAGRLGFSVQKSPLGPDRAPHANLEAVHHANAYVVVVLTAGVGHYIQVGISGVEIARFEARAPASARTTHPSPLRTGPRRYWCRLPGFGFS
jgi:hypothetical protein